MMKVMLLLLINVTNVSLNLFVSTAKALEMIDIHGILFIINRYNEKMSYMGQMPRVTRSHNRQKTY